MDVLKSFCVKECAEWIQSNNFKKVGLEFPEDQLHCISPVCGSLQKKIGFAVYVLETNNKACGNCCITEDKAAQRGIEAIIHFGSSCLTPSISLPVLYVLDSLISFNSDKLIELILSSSDGPKENEDVILLYDLCLAPFISYFYDRLRTHFSNLYLSQFVIPERSKLIFHKDSPNLNFEELNINETSEKILVINNRKLILPTTKELKDYNFIYVCQESGNPAMLSCQMRFSDRIFYLCDHETLSFTRSTFIKTVMGRSRKIEQVRDAKEIGILMTKIYNYEKISSRMGKLIESSNKKYGLFILGKCTEAKLLNITCYDVFVYIGCSESSLFDRHKDKYLYQNVVTPYELEVALNPFYEWSLNFETNFNELLSIYFEEVEEEVKENLPKETNHTEEREKNNTEIIERRPGTLHKMHEGGAGEALQNRFWKGLDPDVESPVPLGTVVEGYSGIPMMYDHESKYKNA